ncbi:hypothetical protein OIV83_001661 [Microbotryomycetes sp. JL201]|nr:hypothetical protein OIV83_001661 [Microbotryomycetes sp. JL201]
MSSLKRRRLSASSSTIGLGESARSPPQSRIEHDRNSHATSGLSTSASGSRRNPLADSGSDSELNVARGSRDHSRDHERQQYDNEHRVQEDDDDDEEEHCAICLSPIANKTVVSPCMHGQFCWGCMKAWSDQSRKCPLCLGPIKLLFHTIRSPTDYAIHYLHTLTTASSSASDDYAHAFASSSNRARGQVPLSLPRHALYGRRQLKRQEDDATWRERKEERALERRRYIYREGLYAKHVASNRFTGFKPFTPQQFANNPDLKARVIKFVRRELQVFPNVDVTFLTTYFGSICSQLDLRSSAAVRLLSDFIPPDDAEHLAHEIVMFARSPFQTLEGFDRMIQYGRPVSAVPKLDVSEQRPSSGKASNQIAYRPAGERLTEFELRRVTPGQAARHDERTQRYSRSVYDDHSYSRHDRSRKTADTSDRKRSRSRESGCHEERLAEAKLYAANDYIAVKNPATIIASSSAKYPQTPEIDQERERAGRNPTPSESDAISFGNESPRSEYDDDGRWEVGMTSEPLKDKTEVMQLAIFGAASRKDGPTEEVGSGEPQIAPTIKEGPNSRRMARIVDKGPTPKPSNSVSRVDKGDEASVVRATTAGPATDLRAKLQARLTAEYRAALVTRAQAQAPALPEALEHTTQQDLRAHLQERLRREKQLTQAQDGDNNFVKLDTKFSDETRRMLLARLEEEKALLGIVTGPSDDSVEADQHDGAKLENAADGQKAEERLRARLRLKTLEKQTGELKEKLMKAKLVKARRQVMQ